MSFIAASMPSTGPRLEWKPAGQITGADLRSRAVWFPWNCCSRLRRQLSSQPLGRLVIRDEITSSNEHSLALPGLYRILSHALTVVWCCAPRTQPS